MVQERLERDWVLKAKGKELHAAGMSGASHCASLLVEVPDSQGKFIGNEQVLPPYPAPLPSSQPLSPAAKP